MKRGYSVRVYGRARTKKNGRKYKDWYVIISLNGKEIEHIKAEPNTEAAAKELKFRKMGELHVGNYVARTDNMLFEEAANRYLQYFLGCTEGPNADRSEGTYTAIAERLRNHLLPRFGHLKLTQVPPLVPDLIEDLKKAYAANTIRATYRTLRGVFTYAKRRLGFPDLLDGVDVDLPLTRRRSSEEIITYDEFLGLLRYLEVRPAGMQKLLWLHLTVMICLAGLMGLRIGEIAGIDCEHCDLDEWKVRVRQQLKPSGRIGQPKYGGVRDIDMDPITHKVLTDYRDFLGKWTGPLISGVNGKRITHTAAGGRILSGVGDAPGLANQSGRSKYSPHIFRHFAGSLWISQGVSVDKTSRQLGHKSYEFTHRTYIHEIEALENRGRIAMQALNGAFPGMRASLPPPIEPIRQLTARDTRPAPERVVSLDDAVDCPTVPNDAPQWMRYAVSLLRSGWSVIEVVEEVGLSEPQMYAEFRRMGLPTPATVCNGPGCRRLIRRTDTDK